MTSSFKERLRGYATSLKEKGLVSIEFAHPFSDDISRAVDEIERLEKALHEIADDRTVHTKENQVRLCCKYQDIASKALEEL